MLDVLNRLLRRLIDIDDLRRRLIDIDDLRRGLLDHDRLRLLIQVIAPIDGHWIEHVREPAIPVATPAAIVG